MKMSVDNLKANLANPARTYLWEVIIPSVVGDGDSETIMLRCQSASLPGREVGNIKVPYKQTAGAVFAGKVTYTQTWDCTFIEGEDSAMMTAFNTWLDEINNPATGIGTAKLDYARDIYITLLAVTEAEYKRIRLVGAWPTKVADVSLDYDQEEIIKLPVTFAYDRWETV